MQFHHLIYIQYKYCFTIGEPLTDIYNSKHDMIYNLLWPIQLAHMNRFFIFTKVTFHQLPAMAHEKNVCPMSNSAVTISRAGSGTLPDMQVQNSMYNFD